MSVFQRAVDREEARRRDVLFRSWRLLRWRPHLWAGWPYASAPSSLAERGADGETG